MTTTLHNSPALQDFLEQPSVKTLQVSVVPTSNGSGMNELACSTTVGLSFQGGTASSGVIFTKRSADTLTAANMASAVMMSTMGASPVQTLQLSIKQLYAPMLLQDPQWATQLDAKTRQTLEALDSALEAAMQLGSNKAGTEDDFSNISSPGDECEHWRLIDDGRLPAATSEQRASARSYWEILRPVCEQLQGMTGYQMASMTLPDVSRLMQDMQSRLDDIFNAGYKESRMLHFLRILGTALDGFLKKKLGALDVWKEPYRKVRSRAGSH